MPVSADCVFTLADGCMLSLAVQGVVQGEVVGALSRLMGLPPKVLEDDAHPHPLHCRLMGSYFRCVRAHICLPPTTPATIYIYRVR